MKLVVTKCYCYLNEWVAPNKNKLKIFGQQKCCQNIYTFISSKLIKINYCLFDAGKNTFKTFISLNVNKSNDYLVDPDESISGSIDEDSSPSRPVRESLGASKESILVGEEKALPKKNNILT